MPYGLTRIYEDDYLIGSPDLIVQIKSRSNRDRNMEEDAIAHITHGAAAVWLVRPERREIVVVTASSRTVHGRNDRIELASPFSGAVELQEIFQD
jgi:Uma2 family endonuclease